ncbi:MAG TPA: TIGR02444 family protein [Caulobacteraceae bacterium]|nr:TIGR02444 family protein [Caulobacteraceae bacterium]
MTREALWPYALEVYGRAGVEPLLLELQDAHGQCVAYLIWALWTAASGRPIGPAEASACAALAAAWQDAAVAPLRRMRRELKPAARTERLRDRIREGVKSLELEAERMLLEMLEEATPAPAGSALAADPALLLAAKAWGSDIPRELLERLARLAT